MRRYKVVFHPDAEADIVASYRWGCRIWGLEKANDWAQRLHRAINSRLTSSPQSCSLAPESEELGVAIRQLILDRHRILFILQKRTVTIIHLRGPHVSHT
jgi:plasmid stabilization system protein ParE